MFAHLKQPKNIYTETLQKSVCQTSPTEDERRGCKTFYFHRDFNPWSVMPTQGLEKVSSSGTSIRGVLGAAGKR